VRGRLAGRPVTAARADNTHSSGSRDRPDAAANHDAVSAADQRIAQALADVAAIGILQQRSAHRSTMLAEHLQRALNSRVIIEQAKGVLAERNAVDMNAAFEALRQYARNHNLKLTELALAVVRGYVEPGAIVARSPAN
jgi:hypothetical protein